MKKALGVVMDPIATINFKKDTTLALLLAADKLGWELFYMEQSDLYVEQAQAYASVHSLKVFDDSACWFELGEQQTLALCKLDVILMRKDPPFDSEFIYSTYILEIAHQQGTLVVNDPRSLRDCNEKMFATQFPQCNPPLLVSRDIQRLKTFHQEHTDTIYKPLDGMGGAQVFRVTRDDPNLTVILETLTQHGKRTIMAQAFIPEIAAGDKRILMIDGEPVPYCLARIPLAGENRGNLAAGGSGVVQPISERDRWIADQVGPSLRDRGLIFVGLDVIGDYLTEVNVTSPTCVREIDREQHLDIGGMLMTAIAKRLS